MGRSGTLIHGTFSRFDRQTSCPDRATCSLSVLPMFAKYFQASLIFFLFVLRAQKRDCKLATQALRETRLLVLTIMFNYCSFQLPLISRGFVSSPSSLGGENRVRFDLQQYVKMLNVGFTYGWIIEKPTQRVFFFN